ncbi:MAG: hypothetical protein AMXMBFR64_60870 [Myxococcales bacterium]
MTITRDDLPQYAAQTRQYRKTAVTSAFELTEPHTICMPEGSIDAQAGDFCCIDSRGEPYPCARDVFLRTYEEVPMARLADEPMLQWFEYAHLPSKLQDVSKPFAELAIRIVATLPRNPERTVALRKLLEAKDCAVRALLST